MTKKQAQALVDECFEPMARAMGMWNPEKLKYRVCKKKKGSSGVTMANRSSPRHKWSTIYVYARPLDDREEFLRAMRHELLHVTQIGFLGFFHTVVEIIPNQKSHAPPRLWFVFEDLYQRDTEDDMIRLENMMDSLGMTGKRILAIGKKMIREL